MLHTSKNIFNHRWRYTRIMVVVHGIVFYIEHRFSPVEIYTDSFLAARVMADQEEEAQRLPEDICDILVRAWELMLIGVFYMYKSANKAAHNLAQMAFHCSQLRLWTTNFPSRLRNIVLDDISWFMKFMFGLKKYIFNHAWRVQPIAK